MHYSERRTEKFKIPLKALNFMYFLMTKGVTDVHQNYLHKVNPSMYYLIILKTISTIFVYSF